MVQRRTGTPPLDILAGSNCSRGFVEVAQLMAQSVDLAVGRAGMQEVVVEVQESVEW